MLYNIGEFCCPNVAAALRETTAAGQTGGLVEHTICAVDIGGSGCRLRLIRTRHSATDGGDAVIERHDMPCDGTAAARPTGSSVEPVLEQACLDARGRWPGLMADLDVLSVGCAGFSSLIDDRNALCARLARMFRCPEVIVAADALTAHAGALRATPGIVVAAGTGVIVLATDYRTFCRRVDGWGYLLGDAGGGSWIGRRALHVALDTYAHRGDLRSNALLDAAIGRFGRPEQWPAEIYPYDERAGILASFVPSVAACAANDPAARRILREAGRELALSVLAALDDAPDLPVSHTGGILAHCDAVRESFLHEVHARRPDARIQAPAGTPLDGAVQLAMRHDAITLRHLAPRMCAVFRTDG